MDKKFVDIGWLEYEVLCKKNLWTEIQEPCPKCGEKLVCFSIEEVYQILNEDKKPINLSSPRARQVIKKLEQEIRAGSVFCPNCSS